MNLAVRRRVRPVKVVTKWGKPTFLFHLSTPT